MGNKSKAKSAARRAFYREHSKNPNAVGGLEAGNALVVVTCPRGREGQCVNECYDLFAEYLAQAEDEQDKDADDGDSDDGDATFQASFERELAALKARGPTTERPLCNVHTKLECVVMFRAAPSVNVVDLVLRILRDIQQTKTAKTRYALRMVPLTKTAKANMADLETLAKELLAPHFHQPDQQPRTFAIQFNARNSTGLQRDEVIKTVAGLVGQPHKVKLDAPELTIIIEAYQHIVGMSVVPDYQKLCRFNLVALVDPTLLLPKLKGAKRPREEDGADAAASAPAPPPAASGSAGGNDAASSDAPAAPA